MSISPTLASNCDLCQSHDGEQQYFKHYSMQLHAGCNDIFEVMLRYVKASIQQQYTIQTDMLVPEEQSLLHANVLRMVQTVLQMKEVVDKGSSFTLQVLKNMSPHTAKTWYADCLYKNFFANIAALPWPDQLAHVKQALKT